MLCSSERIFFSYLTNFSYFPLKIVFQKLQDTITWSEQVKNGHFERGRRWFQLFFIDFSYFIF